MTCTSRSGELPLLKTANVKVIVSPWWTTAGPSLTTVMPGTSFVLTNVQRTFSPAPTLMLAVLVATDVVLPPSLQSMSDRR